MSDVAATAVTSASNPIEASLLAAVERSPLRHQPFDHIYMDRVFDLHSYAGLISALPDRRYFHELSHHDAMRTDGSSTRLRMYLYPELLWRLPSAQRRAWMPIARALCSRALEDAFRCKFRSALQQRFGKRVDKIGLHPVPVLLRDQPGYRIGIHADASRKAITVQFYLPRDFSQRDLGTIFHDGDSGEAAARTTQMPFLPATGYAFPVALAKSWHSAAETSESDGERTSMMVTYYIADGPAARLRSLVTRGGLLLGIHPRV
jgi:hypothetical protein